MKKLAAILVFLTTLLYFGGAPALAQRGGGMSGRQGNMPGMHGNPMGTQAGQGMGHPDMGQKGHMGNGPSMSGQGMGSQQREGRPTASEQLTQNPKLSSQLEDLFPAGTNLPQTSAGFKNLGEFVAAAHVSHNLGIPFHDLKAKMTSGKNLGEAIHELRPDADYKAESRKAREQARKDMKESGKQAKGGS